jgi:integration host factor subunit beta
LGSRLFALPPLHVAKQVEFWAPSRRFVLTKKDIIREIAVRTHTDQITTKEIVQRFLDRVLEVLLKTGRLELRNFGIFEIKQRAPRKARNPRTNTQLTVPSKKVLTFQPGKNVARIVEKASWSPKKN